MAITHNAAVGTQASLCDPDNDLGINIKKGVAGSYGCFYFVRMRQCVSWHRHHLHAHERASQFPRALAHTGYYLSLL